MCNFSKKGDKTESFLAMTVVAAEQLIQKHGPKYPAITTVPLKSEKVL